MLFSDALEVAIGLSFIFLLVSLIMTAVAEYIESVRKTRGRVLLDGIMEMLGDPKRSESGLAAAKAIYEHPQVQGLYIGSFDSALADKQLPSYLPSRNFALALIDQVLSGQVSAAPSTATLPAYAPLGDRLLLAAERVQNEQLRRALQLAVQVAGSDAERLRRYIEDWFNAAMDRASGRYKRVSQHLLFKLGIAGALVMNVNALTIADSLSKDATLRRAVVAQAEKQSATVQTTTEAVNKIHELGLPIGWSTRAVQLLSEPLQRDGAAFAAGVVQLVLGYLLTALAVTLGSPFWFDLLKKLMVVRSTVKPPDNPEGAPGPGGDRRAGGGAAAAATAGAAAGGAAAAATAQAGAAATPAAPMDRDIYAGDAVPLAEDRPIEEWQ